MDLNRFLKKADELIEKIPLHIRDLLQKISLALAALLAIIGIFLGYKYGTEAASPGGEQLAGKTRDLFADELLKEERAEATQFIEDIEVSPTEFQDFEKTMTERMSPQDLGKVETKIPGIESGDLRDTVRDPYYMLDDVDIKGNDDLKQKANTSPNARKDRDLLELDQKKQRPINENTSVIDKKNDKAKQAQMMRDIARESSVFGKKNGKKNLPDLLE